MADAITIKELKDASLDAKSLAEFVFKPASFMVQRRLAPSINTLQHYLDLFENISIGGEFNSAKIESLTVSTGEAGTQASVITGGTPSNRTFALTIPKGDKGADGKSAYQSALDNGFVGTEAEWKLYLKSDGSIQALQQFMTNSAATDVTIPDYGNIPSLQGYISTMFENGGLPATPFKTKALMTASALVDGDYAMVTDDTGNDGLYVKTAGAWVKSEYDPLSQVKDYFNASGVRTEDADELDEYQFAVLGNDDKAPWGIHRTGVVRQPRISTDVINNMGIEEADEFSGYVFGVLDKNNNSPLALRADGTVRAPRIELEYINGEPVRDFLPSDNNSNSIPASTQEWWIGPVHTFLREPYERIVSGMYGEDGQIYVCEHIPGAGVISRYEIGRTPGVDDHNAPALHAESGRRFIAVWSRHSADEVMRIRVSDVRGDLASFNDIAEQNLIVPGGYTYAQVYKITHLSDAAQDTFWVFGRSSQKGWGYTQLSVDQASGEISSQEWVHLFTGAGYLAFADDYTEGEQRIRVAFGYNPASDGNSLYYMEINCVTGDMIMPPASAPVGNMFDKATHPVAVNQGGVIPQTSTHDRRLFYARPGPQSPAILYAEWPVGDPDGAVYKLASLVDGSWVVRDHGNVGSRMGYVESANYLAGGSFPDPCFDDVLYLASHDDATGISTLSVHRTVGGTTNIRTLSETSQGRIIRPISPKGGSPFITYGLVTDYGFAGYFSFRGSIKFQTIGGNL